VGSVHNTTIVVPPPSSSSPGSSSSLTAKSTSHAGAIAGGVVGGVVGLGLVAFAAIFFYRRRCRAELNEKDDDHRVSIDSHTLPNEITPFVPQRAREALPVIEAEETSSHGAGTMSEKVREYLDSRAIGPVGAYSSASTSTPSGVSSAPASVVPPSSPGSSTQISPVELRGLRTEVENLRRVMQEIHAERLPEAPPEYEPAAEE